MEYEKRRSWKLATMLSAVFLLYVWSLSFWPAFSLNASDVAKQPEAADGRPAADAAEDKGLAERTSFTLEQAKDVSFMQESLQGLPRVRVVATGYTAGVESTGKSPGHPEYGVTYSGVKVRRDLYSTIAADLNLFPLGTILYIPGYGYGVVADTGSAIQGNRIDLYYPTVEQVYKEWGKKEVEVSVVKKGDGKLAEETMLRLNQEALPVQG